MGQTYQQFEEHEKAEVWDGCLRETKNQIFHVLQ